MTTRPQRMGQSEFIVLMAMLFATIAFSIDSMLPALPEIAGELSPGNINKAQLILTSFILGLGMATFFTGPISDRFGRKPVMIIGMTIYVIAALLAWRAPTLETLLAARFLQGVGAAGPRVVSMAVVRDLFAGRIMAKILSITMIIFTLVPAVAPFIGAFIIDTFGWRFIFIAYVVFMGMVGLWLVTRLDESLAIEDRRDMSWAKIKGALRDMFTHPMVRNSIWVQSLCFAMLYQTLTLIQPIFDDIFHRHDSFPMWFAIIALIAATASFTNAALVGRLGMRLMVTLALGGQIVLATLITVLWICQTIPLDAYFYIMVAWITSVFFQTGLTLGNLNALAMEPMGHIAGMAASIIGAVATIVGVTLAVPVGLMFSGTPLPLTITVLIEAVIGFVIIRHMAKLERG